MCRCLAAVAAGGCSWAWCSPTGRGCSCLGSSQRSLRRSRRAQLPWWRLVVATIASIALVVGWLVIDGELWDRPDIDSPQARERSRLYNTSTLVSLTAGVVICYVALYVVNLAWALFVLDPAVMSRDLQRSLAYGDLFVLAWFVASAATVGGALGSGLESDEAIRAAAYSKREEERRNRLAREQT